MNKIGRYIVVLGRAVGGAVNAAMDGNRIRNRTHLYLVFTTLQTYEIGRYTARSTAAAAAAASRGKHFYSTIPPFSIFIRYTFFCASFFFASLLLYIFFLWQPHFLSLLLRVALALISFIQFM